jgi:hypothetical protein
MFLICLIGADIVLLSDLIAGCYSSSYQPLVDALWWLSGSEGSTSTIIMAYEKRDKKELDFFRILLKQFSFRKVQFYVLLIFCLLLLFVQVDNSKLDPLYQSEDIGIFIIKRL